MDEVKPWISDYFINLATTHGSQFYSAPPVEKTRKCQLKKVLTLDPEDYCWVILSDKQHEIPGRIPRDVVDQCLKNARRNEKFTRHTGSLIDIRDFTPLFIRIEDGPSTSTTREVLALEIKKLKLRGASREPVWGSPQPLDTVPELKEWLYQLRKPDGDRDVLKARKKQQDDAKTAKQFSELSELSPCAKLHLQPATYAPPPVLRKAASTTSTVDERLPMQRYRRKWHKTVPGLNEFARRLQMPEDVRLKILEKQTNKKAEAKPRSSGAVLAKRPPNVRGALEIGSSPARLSPVPCATTPEEWPTSPGGLKRLYDDHETDMSSDADSSRVSSPIDTYRDVEMNEVEPQPEIVPETPQVAVDSQPQHPSPPPPAQPPRPRSPLTSSSNPQMLNDLTSPGSIHTSIRAVTGSQLPSLEKPPTWPPSYDEPSGGPTFVLPWSQRDDPSVAVPKPNPEARPSPEKQPTKLPSPVKEPALPITSKPPQEKETATKKVARGLAFGESVFQAIELAFQQGDPVEAVPTPCDASVALPVPKVTVAQLPPPKPRPKPPSKVTQNPLPGPSPSPLDRLEEINHSESPVRRPFEVLNRKVPLPEVGPTREPVRGRNENGAPTVVLIPASDDTKLSSPLKQNSSSQPVQSSQSIPSSCPLLPITQVPPSQPITSSQIPASTSQPGGLVAEDGDSIVVQVNETVADAEKLQDLTGNTQSSLEYASTQDENRVVVDAQPGKLAGEPPEVVVATGEAGDEPLTSPLPQIATIREPESQQSGVVENEEEVDELEDDSDIGGRRPVAKPKPKLVSKPVKTTKRPNRSEPAKPAPPSKSPSKPPSRSNSVVEKVPSWSSSKLPPKPVVLIDRKRTPGVPTNERASTAQKRRLSTPSSEGFPLPQPIKRSRIYEHPPPVRTILPPMPQTPPLQEGRNSVVLSASRSAKGKERAEGIKGLENINASEDVEREGAELPVKKKAPDTGSKRKPSDAFSSRDDSRDIKRQKVAQELEQRKPKKQLSFVDPDKLKQPFQKPQIRKTSAQHGTTTTATAESPVVARQDKDGRTSKYFNPQSSREPEYPLVTTTPETEPPQRAIGPKPDIRSKETVRENGRDPGELRPRIDSRKTSTSNSDRQLPGKSRKTSRAPDDNQPPGRSTAPTRIQHPKHVKNAKKDSAPPESQYPAARKLGSFAPDLNPPPLQGLPGGMVMNKQLREILIRTGKVRVREAKAAESNRNS